jgi:uncharacterized protein
MSDPENIPPGERELELSPLEGSDPSAAPGDMSAPVSTNDFAQPDASATLASQTYPPSWFPSQSPPSPEELRLASLPLELRVPWGWADCAVFLLFYIGSTIVLGVATLLGAAAILHIDPRALQQRQVLVVSLTIAAQAAGSIASMFYFWGLTRLRRAGNFWPAFGWCSLNGTTTNLNTAVGYLFGGVALAVAVSLLGMFVKQTGPVPFEEFFKARQSVFMLMGFGILVAPLVEETMFRGFLYPVAARQFGVAPGIIFTGILFGAFHGFQLWGAWAQVGILMGVGIVLTWIRARSGSVLASFLVHIAYNSTLFAGLFISSHGLHDIPVGK